MDHRQDIINQAKAAKKASLRLRQLSTPSKNQALLSIAEALDQKRTAIIEANQKDLARASRLAQPLQRRLRLDEHGIDALLAGVRAVASLPDPVGEIGKMSRRPNGLRIATMRIPIGVICCIYESRPNVTVNIAALALKSGNACIVRGGKEVSGTNTVLVDIIKEAVSAHGIPKEFVQHIEPIDHNAISTLAGLSDYIDVMIPRGGEDLIDVVTKHATMPVLRHRKGVTHIYVDRDADLDKAGKIIVNAKTSNPSVCNSLEKVLIDSAIATRAVPHIVTVLQAAGVEVRGCEETRRYAPVVPATPEDWSREYLDYIIALKIVDGIDAAMEHIARFGTGLADGIVTEHYGRAWQFLTGVDSAATYVNASTRFTDGGEFGLGAEIGISTSKIHGMGPMGLEALTTTKYIVFGDGQIRE